MSDPFWFLRDNAEETCGQCGYLLHAENHDHMHQAHIEWGVGQFRREFGIETPGPHLHWEVRQGHRRIDPLRWTP